MSSNKASCVCQGSQAASANDMLCESISSLPCTTKLEHEVRRVRICGAELEAPPSLDLRQSASHVPQRRCSFAFQSKVFALPSAAPRLERQG